VHAASIGRKRRYQLPWIKNLRPKNCPVEDGDVTVVVAQKARTLAPGAIAGASKVYLPPWQVRQVLRQVSGHEARQEPWQPSSRRCGVLIYLYQAYGACLLSSLTRLG
jgi:hypothetical protein